MGHSVSQYFDFFDRFHCQNYLLDLVRVLIQPCNHSVIFVQINPGVVRCVVNSLGWNDISLQNVVRAVSGLEVKHCFDPARLKLGVCLENPSISHAFSRKHTRCLDQVSMLHRAIRSPVISWHRLRDLVPAGSRRQRCQF